MCGRVLEHEGRTILNQGIAIGEERGRSDALNVAIEFMRSNGMSKEQMDSFRDLVLKPE